MTSRTQVEINQGEDSFDRTMQVIVAPKHIRLVCLVSMIINILFLIAVVWVSVELSCANDRMYDIEDQLKTERQKSDSLLKNNLDLYKYFLYDESFEKEKINEIEFEDNKFIGYYIYIKSKQNHEEGKYLYKEIKYTGVEEIIVDADHKAAVLTSSDTSGIASITIQWRKDDLGDFECKIGDRKLDAKSSKSSENKLKISAYFDLDQYYTLHITFIPEKNS